MLQGPASSGQGGVLSLYEEQTKSNEKDTSINGKWKMVNKCPSFPAFR